MPQPRSAAVALAPARRRPPPLALEPAVGRLRRERGGVLLPATPAELLAFSRAGVALDFDAAGAAAAFAADALRTGFDPNTLAPLGWLLEGAAATGGHRNPRAEGAATATLAPGAATPVPATRWTLPNRLSGLSLDVSPAGAFGMTGVRLRWYGTTLGSGFPIETVEFEARNAVAAAAGQSWTGTVYYRRVAGTKPAAVAVALRFLSLSSGGGVVDNVTGPALALDASLRRAAQTTTTGAGAAFVCGGLHLSGWPLSTAVDFAIELFFPQLEPAAFATSPALPPAGTQAAGTRAADALRLADAAFAAAFPPGATPRGCLVVEGALDAQGSVLRTFAQLDDGTNNNRLVLRPTTAGGQVVALATAGGTQQPTAFAGGVLAYGGAPFRAGLRWDGGGYAVCLNGGALGVQAVGGGAALPAFSALRLGANATGGEPLAGRLRAVWAAPWVPADGAFRAACVPGAPAAELLAAAG